MWKTIGALLHKGGFKPSKLKSELNLAVSRSAVLKNQRKARVSIARSDVVELLKIQANERALLRVERVIKEQNVLDVIHELESCCHVLIERIHLVEQEKYCPDELKEAASTLIFASSRIGDFPELLELRSMFASRYGKEFVLRAAELRNNCGVNPKIVQKLSTRTPSWEIRQNALEEIAAENGIDLPSEEQQPEKRTKQQVVDDDPPKMKTQQYRDVADAAQAAFESAAYAASAARAAVELYR
ncbi:hypothetical protein M569_09937, partial [Genlisea aurea]